MNDVSPHGNPTLPVIKARVVGRVDAACPCVAGLAPYEFVRVRGLVVCAPAPEPPTQGRILDV